MIPAQGDFDRDIIVLDDVDLSADIPAATATTREFAPEFADSADLTPMDNVSGLAGLYRARLRETTPRIFALAEVVSRRLANRDMAVIVPSLGVAHYALGEQRFVLFALSHLLGSPTATEPRTRRVLWDVKPRRDLNVAFATYSEHANEAELHTDNTFSAHPEASFFLYVVQEAQCGGGLSYFSNGMRIRDHLARTASGRAAIDLLGRTPVSFRVPSTLSQNPAVPEYISATIFAERPEIRFRQDVILSGLKARPGPDSADVEVAVNRVADAAQSVRTSELKLPTGGIAFVDNHNALHGRSGFEDKGRHLIRVRMSP
ncbi:MAG: TauD/TfdA family dioxygenase [Hyphomicrobiales bacterium]|nr:TauD/TfdA family dioxygenase [Hyphomicrobiales bacterium]